MKIWIFFMYSLHFYDGLLALGKCIEDICIPSDYNRRIRPLLNETNDVQVDLTNIKILNINDFDCSITLSIWLYLKWIDPRLIVPEEVPDFIALGSIHK